MITPDFSHPDSGSTIDRLGNYTGIVPWSYLLPHHTTGNLYFVDPSLELATVGAAMSANKVAQVESWLKSGDMVKIEAIHAAQWQDGGKEFEALVVTPFVLCRPL